MEKQTHFLSDEVYTFEKRRLFFEGGNPAQELRLKVEGQAGEDSQKPKWKTLEQLQKNIAVLDKSDNTDENDVFSHKDLQAYLNQTFLTVKTDIRRAQVKEGTSPQKTEEILAELEKHIQGNVEAMKPGMEIARNDMAFLEKLWQLIGLLEKSVNETRVVSPLSQIPQSISSEPLQKQEIQASDIPLMEAIQKKFPDKENLKNLSKEQLISTFFPENMKEWNVLFLNLLGYKDVPSGEEKEVITYFQKLLGVDVDGRVRQETLLAVLNQAGVTLEEFCEKEIPKGLELTQLSGDQFMLLRKKVGFKGIQKIYGLKNGINAAEEDSDEAFQRRIMMYDGLIIEAARKYGVENTDHIKALIYHESRGRFNAASGTGSFGLMQLAQDIYKESKAYPEAINPFNVEQSIDRGVRFFSDLFKKYDGDLAKVTTAYNTGEPVLDDLIDRYGKEWAKHLPSSQAITYYRNFQDAMKRRPWEPKTITNQS